MIADFVFSVGYVSMSLLSYWFPAWRTLTYVLAALAGPFVLTGWLWPESPSWLYSVERYSEGERVISTFIGKCKVDLSDFSDPNSESIQSNEQRFLKILRKKCKPEIEKEAVESLPVGQKYSVLSLFTSGGPLAMTAANICFQWVVIIMTVYGLNFGAGDLPRGLISGG